MDVPLSDLHRQLCLEGPPRQSLDIDAKTNDVPRHVAPDPVTDRGDTPLTKRAVKEPTVARVLRMGVIFTYTGHAEER